MKGRNWFLFLALQILICASTGLEGPVEGADRRTLADPKGLGQGDAGIRGFHAIGAGSQVKGSTALSRVTRSRWDAGAG